ncbi:unnamed protein product [Acanthoscelides obtectus]|uniref:Uncharacterized protein n=1 Tax=Acanthoscelides obtectus TaxID=200917 RepID=A0A9P0Q8I0_ACAOB|nr:unnamed protein product [Acanthoscelides obtectus]CAK1659711.1 hypothetical protein AOBTE_LOCUS21638 [Acanthoscelides obtectus]
MQLTFSFSLSFSRSLSFLLLYLLPLPLPLLFLSLSRSLSLPPLLLDGCRASSGSGGHFACPGATAGGGPTGERSHGHWGVAGAAIGQTGVGGGAPIGGAWWGWCGAATATAGGGAWWPGTHNLNRSLPALENQCSMFFAPTAP